MGCIDDIIVLRCVIGFFFVSSVLCLYVAIRHPDLPKRVMESLVGAVLGDEAIKHSHTYTNWWLLWFFPFFFLALWVAFELWLKDFVACPNDACSLSP